MMRHLCPDLKGCVWSPMGGCRTSCVRIAVNDSDYGMVPLPPPKAKQSPPKKEYVMPARALKPWRGFR